MKQKLQPSNLDPEIVAISAVYVALKELNQESQARVVDYVSGKLGLRRSGPPNQTEDDSDKHHRENTQLTSEKRDPDEFGNETSEELEGISPVARKWMRRNGLNASQLTTIFSLGVDEIDLVAKTVPGGKNKKEKMRSVFLLKGVAAYLGGGAARFTHEQAKETCLHYDAYDSSNLSAYLKGMSSEVSGNKEAGYQLSARGLASATALVKQLTQGQKPVN